MSLMPTAFHPIMDRTRAQSENLSRTIARARRVSVYTVSDIRQNAGVFCDVKIDGTKAQSARIFCNSNINIFESTASQPDCLTVDIAEQNNAQDLAKYTKLHL